VVPVSPRLQVGNESLSPARESALYNVTCYEGNSRPMTLGNASSAHYPALTKPPHLADVKQTDNV
jgi:hypothetical protein